MAHPSLLNKALYYWGWYKLNGHHDELAGAIAFLADYRKSGGTDRPDLDPEIRSEFTRLESAPPSAQFTGRAPQNLSRG